jgi:hypothetical protein
MKMSSGEFAAASIVRAWEPPEEVVVPYALAYSPDLQPEDYGVLIRLLLRDPELPTGVAALAKEFQASGWKMGDSRLRGVMARLRKAGHVSRRRDGYDADAGRPRWAFVVYRNPANNPQYVAQGIAASSQLSATRGIPTQPASGTQSGTLISNVYAGQADTLEIHASAADALDSDALDSNVYAGQADTLVSNASGLTPPTPPPGGGGTSSPYPLTTAPATGGRETEEGEERAAHLEDPARLAAARDFLEELPAPWRAGRKTARDLAPLLLEASIDQGWELGPELVRHLTRNPGGVRSYPATLKSRIADLPRVTKPRRAGSGPAADADRCPHHPARELATCPCQLADQPSPQQPAADPAEDPEAVRAAAQRALESLRGRAVGGGQTKTARRKSRTRAGREEAARQAEAVARDAANALLQDADDAGEAR